MGLGWHGMASMIDEMDFVDGELCWKHGIGRKGWRRVGVDVDVDVDVGAQEDVDRLNE